MRWVESIHSWQSEKDRYGETIRRGGRYMEGGYDLMNAVQEQYVVDSKGKKTAVILPLKRYEKLLEDLHDLAVVAERRDEKPISLEEMKRRLREDGIL